MSLLAEGRRRVKKQVLTELAEFPFILWKVEFEDDAALISVTGWVQVKHPHQDDPETLRVHTYLSMYWLNDFGREVFFEQLRRGIADKLAQAILAGPKINSRRIVIEPSAIAREGYTVRVED